MINLLLEDLEDLLKKEIAEIVTTWAISSAWGLNEACITGVLRDNNTKVD